MLQAEEQEIRERITNGCIQVKRAFSRQRRSQTESGGHSAMSFTILLDTTKALLLDISSCTLGNVEIFHVGRWGSICDDEWDDRDAQVVCRELGLPGVARATQNSYFGEAKGRIVVTFFLLGRRTWVRRFAYCHSADLDGQRVLHGRRRDAVGMPF